MRASCILFFVDNLALYVLDVCRVIELLDRLQRSGELPPPKLQALQRVLQSKFCAAIREVWVYSEVLVEVWGYWGCSALFVFTLKYYFLSDILWAGMFRGCAFGGLRSSQMYQRCPLNIE